MERLLNNAYKTVKHTVLQLSPMEVKVLDATSNDPWGPHGATLNELAEASHHFEDCQLILSVLYKRMEDEGKDWRHVYKSMAVLEHLVTSGSERALNEICQGRNVLRRLEHFQYHEPNGKDQVKAGF
jgi:epsin